MKKAIFITGGALGIGLAAARRFTRFGVPVAAHGPDRDYIVGKAGRQARFAARFLPGRLRQRMKAAMRDD